MPPGSRPQPPVDTIRVALGGTAFTLPFTLVLWLRVTTDGTRTAADLKTVVDAFVAAWFLRFKGTQTASVIYTNVDAVWLTGVGTELTYVNSFNDVCTGAAGVGNVASCIVVDWAINAYYRGGHPRTYLPGPILGSITNAQSLTSAYAALVAAAGVSVIADVAALTATHILTTALGTVSFASGNAWRVPPIFRPYTSAACRPIMGTQRRRLGGR